MKRFATSIVLTFALIVAQPPSAQSTELAKSEYVEWNLGFFWLKFGVNGLHTDIQKYLPWYRYDPENAPFVSSQAPLSMRTPKSILLDFSKNECVAIPLQIRREVGKNFASDTLNPLSVDIYPLILNRSTSKYFDSKPILSIGPSDWIGDSDQIEKQVSVCKEIIGTSKKSLDGSSLTLAYVTKYERDISALQGEISKCEEMLNGKCVFSVRYAGSIGIQTNNLSAIEQPNRYNLEIKKLQDFLDSKPCYPGGIGDQLLSNIYCSNAMRNIEILNRELPVIQAAADKAAAHKAAADKAVADKAAADSFTAAMAIRIVSAQELFFDTNLEIDSLIKLYPSKKTELILYKNKLAPFESINQSNVPTAEVNLKGLATKIEMLKKLYPKLSKSITCTKGKKAVKVKDVKPVCPVGYKKK
jgi:hypothetical protein